MAHQSIGRCRVQSTAVEWLAEKFNYLTWLRNRDEISALTAEQWKINYLEQAKRLERDQIEDAWVAGRDFGCKYDDYETAEEYYNKTFKKD